MDNQHKDHGRVRGHISFPNGNRARLAVVWPGTPVPWILKALEIASPKALILIVGGASGLEGDLVSRLEPLFSGGIAATAAETGALIMDGGTEAGVMALTGRGVAAQGYKPILLGVAPAGRVVYPGKPAEGSIEDAAALDSNHSHFVLVECEEWGGETETMYELAAFVGARVPSLAILANGGKRTRTEVLRNVDGDRDVILIRGSGRLADDIAGTVEDSKASHPEIAAIARYDRLTLFDIEAGPEALAVLIREKLRL